MRILLIEEDPIIAEEIRAGLTAARYLVEMERDGENGLRVASQGSFGLVILDPMLPRRDGISVCAALRARKLSVPILMLTARDGVTDRVRGLEAGADDYLAKPFEFTELLARVRALLRRDKVHKAQVICIGDLTIDTSEGRVQRAGHEIHLTPREYTLLEALAKDEGRILSRKAIVERVWMDEQSYSNTVSVHMVSLRRKVDSGHATPLIQTIHGKGYMMVAP